MASWADLVPSSVLGMVGITDAMVTVADETLFLQYKTAMRQTTRFFPSYWPTPSSVMEKLPPAQAKWISAASCSMFGFALALTALQLARVVEERTVELPAEKGVAAEAKMSRTPSGVAKLGDAESPASEDLGLFQSLRKAGLWLGFSSALTVHNAWIFKSGFPHVVCLASFHLLLCTCLGLFIFIFKREWMTRLPSNPLAALAGVALPALLGTGGIVCGNLSYLYLPVHTVQTSKAVIPLVTFAISCSFGLESWNWQMMASLVVVIVGTIVNVASEATFASNSFAALVVAASLILECARLVSLKYVLSSRGHGLDPLSSLLFYSPLQLICLVPMAINESRQINLAVVQNVLPSLALNGFFAVGLNLAMLFLLQGISSTTHATLGSLRDVLVVAAAAVVLQTCPQPRQAFGIGLVIGGVFVYNKLKADISQRSKT